MNRREAIQRVAMLMGGALSAPALLAALNGHAKEPGPDWKPAALGRDELAIVARIVDIMLPRTDLPGALDAGVPAFIDSMLAEVYTKSDREHYLEGLHEFDAAAAKAHRKVFLQLLPELQLAHVKNVQSSAISAEREGGAKWQKQLAQQIRDAKELKQNTHVGDHAHRRSFILATKELALLGFFTSQPGATQVLQYVAIPGAYHGCLPRMEAGNGKTWATN
jgi:hypothetical protein